jgi:hypothetical protein
MGKFINVFDRKNWSSEEKLPAIEADTLPRIGDALTAVVRTDTEVLDHFNIMPHVRRLAVYFFPEGDVVPGFTGQAELVAVSELFYDKETDSVSTRQELSIQFKPDNSGTIYGSSYSNFFGMKRSSKRIILK